MEHEHFDQVAKRLATNTPRRPILAQVMGALALVGVASLPGPIGDTLAKKKRKKRKKKAPRCAPQEGVKRISLPELAGPNRCTCVESQAELLEQIKVEQCTGLNDPQCPAKSRCGEGTSCTTALDRAGAPVGSFYEPNAACPGGMGCVFKTSGDYDCTCGCAAK